MSTVAERRQFQRDLRALRAMLNQCQRCGKPARRIGLRVATHCEPCAAGNRARVRKCRPVKTYIRIP